MRKENIFYLPPHTPHIITLGWPWNHVSTESCVDISISFSLLFSVCLCEMQVYSKPEEDPVIYNTIDDEHPIVNQTYY